MVWCGKNNLILNVNKTEEMIVDFRIHFFSIIGEDVEVVEENKYIRVYRDNRLDWRNNTDAGCSYLLSVCCGECSLICSHLLGEQHQSQ